MLFKKVWTKIKEINSKKHSYRFVIWWGILNPYFSICALDGIQISGSVLFIILSYLEATSVLSKSNWIIELFCSSDIADQVIGRLKLEASSSNAFWAKWNSGPSVYEYNSDISAPKVSSSS